MESLLKENIIQMSLFDQKIAEVQTDAGIRYVLRNNHVRAEDMRQSRENQ
jgi:hypothetical protein